MAAIEQQPFGEQAYFGPHLSKREWISQERPDYNNCRTGGLVGDPSGPSFIRLSEDPEERSAWAVSYLEGWCGYQQTRLDAINTADIPAVAIGHARIAAELPFRSDLILHDEELISDPEVAMRLPSRGVQDVLAKVIETNRSEIAGDSIPAWEKALKHAMLTQDSHLQGIAHTELGAAYRRRGMAEVALEYCIDGASALRSSIASTPEHKDPVEAVQTTAEMDEKALHLVFASLGGLAAIRQMKSVDDGARMSFRGLAYALEDFSAPSDDVVRAYKALSGHVSLFSREKAFFREQAKLARHAASLDLSVFLRRVNNRVLRPETSPAS